MASTWRMWRAAFARLAACSTNATDEYCRLSHELADQIRRSSISMRNADKIGADKINDAYGIAAAGIRPALVRSYQVRDRVERADGSVVRRPVGVVVGGDSSSILSKVAALQADSAHVGYLRIPVRRWSPEGIVQRWQNGLRHRKLRAEWIPTPLYPPAVHLGRPPIMIDIHHGPEGFQMEVLSRPQRAPLGRTLPDGEYREMMVPSSDLAELMRENKYLNAARAANPGSDVWLLACKAHDEAQVVADTLGMTTHAVNGYPMNLPAAMLEGASVDPTRLPFTVNDGLLSQVHRSLAEAPPQLQRLAEDNGWRVTAIFVQPDQATGQWLPPVVTCHPR